MGAKYIIIACLLCASFVCPAQKAQTRDSILNTERFVPQSLTTNEFINYQLPPLDSLFESAKSNPRLKAIEASIEAARNDLNISLFVPAIHTGYWGLTQIKKPSTPP